MRYLRIAVPAFAIAILVPSFASGSARAVATGCGTPTITSVSPNSGPPAGGTSVTITGTNFFGSVAVTFGGVNATNVVAVSSTSITATTPAGAPGPVDVTVISDACGNVTLPAGFTYAGAAVPALSTLALILLGVALGIAALFVMRR